MVKNHFVRRAGFITVVAFLLLSYQNCGPAFVSNSSTGASLSSNGVTPTPSPNPFATATPTPIPASAVETLELGAYGQNSLQAEMNFENFVGRKADGILVYAGRTTWADFNGSVGFVINLWKNVDRKKYWSLPLITDDATLEIGATGAYNTYYQKAAKEILASRPNDTIIQIRTGWEFNGGWFPWAAFGHEQAFIGTFRQFVDTFRAVSPKFRFEWNVNMGYSGNTMNPETAYPGDSYVDIIGMDSYYAPLYSSPDPATAVTYNIARPYGLKWHQDFAKARGKQTSYSEWGVTGNNAGPYIIGFKKWMVDHHVVFHTYWDSNSGGYIGQLSAGQFPATAAVFKSNFQNVIFY